MTWTRRDLGRLLLAAGVLLVGSGTGNRLDGSTANVQITSSPTLHRRAPGKRGRLSSIGFDRGPLKPIHEYAPLAAPAYPVDVSGGITNWGMLGNGPDPTCTVRPNGVGDCTFAGLEHYRMAKAARGKEVETWETSNELVEEYLRYVGGVDRGANIPTLLMDWFHAGKILAFAPIDHTDPLRVDAAVSAFSGVFCGVNLTGDADNLFSNHLPWTVSNGQAPDPQHGHCIVKVAADGQGTDTWVTWGGLQKSTTDWTAACLEEAWVIITDEDTQSSLIDLKALLADIAALGGMAQAA